MICINILICLYYNAEMGGLHDNVFATAKEAKERGHNVYVACRPGIFNDYLKHNGINTVTIDQDKIIDSIEKIKNETGMEIDLIHAHPGTSRIISLRLHAEFQIPVIYHVHGVWHDNVQTYIDEVECVFAVSESVRQEVINVCNGYEHKVFCILNYSEYDFIEGSFSNNGNKIVSLITRLDKDKKLIMDEVLKLIPFLNQVETPLRFEIIGDGKLRKDFLTLLRSQINNENVDISFIGWIEDKELLKRYIEKSDVVIGPGRVAIDAFTLGTPVIIVGSQNYQGILDETNWQFVVNNNFGGFGFNNINRSISDDLEGLLFDESKYTSSLQIGRQILETFFDKKKTLNKMFSIYKIVEMKNEFVKSKI